MKAINFAAACCLAAGMLTLSGCGPVSTLDSGTLCEDNKIEPHPDGNKMVGGATLVCSIPLERIYLQVKLERRDTTGTWQVMAENNGNRVPAPGVNQTRTEEVSAKCLPGVWKTVYQVSVTPVDPSHVTGLEDLKTDETPVMTWGKKDCA